MSEQAARPSLQGYRVTLSVTGSIAAYKAVVLLRRLMDLGAEVEVVMTAAAQNFVGTATFSGLSGRNVHTDAFGSGVVGELHVALAKRSDLVIIAPATADVLARLAQGRADDLVAALALCARCPLLLAPAMHPRMWEHTATQRNREWLGQHGGVHFIGPVEGTVASGDRGIGRMAEPEAILEEACRLLRSRETRKRTLSGRRVIVTAGPTLEALDPVRYLGNRSSGKLGFALARALFARGAEVVLITGPVALATPRGVLRHDIESALELKKRLWDELGPDLGGADAVLMAAAVGDYRARERVDEKLPRVAKLELALTENPDVIREIGAKRTGERPLLVAFALESARGPELISRAQRKLAEKKVDAVVANHTDAMGQDASEAVLVTRSSETPLSYKDKPKLADEIADWVCRELEPRLP